jgi:hypothetical protein
MGDAPLLNGQLPQPFMPAQTQVIDKLQWTLGHPSPLLFQPVSFIILAAHPTDKDANNLLPPPITPEWVEFALTGSFQLKMNKNRNLSNNDKNHSYTTLEVYRGALDLHQ